MNQVGINCLTATADQSKSPGVQQSNLPSKKHGGNGRNAVSRLEAVRTGTSSQEGNKTPEQGERPVKSSPLLWPGKSPSNLPAWGAPHHVSAPAGPDEAPQSGDTPRWYALSTRAESSA